MRADRSATAGGPTTVRVSSAAVGDMPRHTADTPHRVLVKVSNVHQAELGRSLVRAPFRRVRDRRRRCLLRVLQKELLYNLWALSRLDSIAAKACISIQQGAGEHAPRRGWSMPGTVECVRHTTLVRASRVCEI